MIRSFGIITLAGTSADPLFSDKLTAAFSNISSGGVYQATVANSAIYQVGDRWIFGAGSGSPTNCMMVTKIVDSTHVQFMSEGNAAVSNWNSGTVLALDIACAQILIQSQTGNSASGYLGSDSTVTNSGGGSAFAQIATGGAYTLGIAQWNCLRTTEAFLAGATSDKYGIAALII
jgi:hypothetical protein